MANGDSTVINNSVRLLGEAFVTPGSSLILDGKIGYGLLHGFAGIAAISFLGPIAGPLVRLAIAANSYSSSVSQKNLYQDMRDGLGTTGDGGATGSAPVQSSGRTVEPAR